ncbi:hypothetical protein ABPG75_003470 [Micractinium tetrahymenae]
MLLCASCKCGPRFWLFRFLHSTSSTLPPVHRLVSDTLAGSPPQSARCESRRPSAMVTPLLKPQAVSFRATTKAPASCFAAPSLQAAPMPEEEALATELYTELSAGSGSLAPPLRLLIKEQQEVAYDVISAELRSSGNWRDAPWAQLAGPAGACCACRHEVATH